MKWDEHNLGSCIVRITERNGWGYQAHRTQADRYKPPQLNPNRKEYQRLQTAANQRYSEGRKHLNMNWELGVTNPRLGVWWTVLADKSENRTWEQIETIVEKHAQSVR